MSEINIEEETIKVEDAWKSASELKEEIKGRIEKGDFDITDEALALKELTATMQGYTEIQLKLPNDLLEETKKNADAEDVTFQEILRKSILGGGAVERKAKTGGAVEEKKKVEKAERGEPEWEEEEAEEEAEETEEEAEEEVEEEKPKPIKVRCHNCRKPITISSSERPITVTCPHCGAQGRLEK